MADETAPAPLSDAEIAAIQKRLNNLWQARDDMKRLLATLAAYREIVAAVGNMDAITRYHLILQDRAHALLAGTPALGAAGATVGEEGEA